MNRPQLIREILSGGFQKYEDAGLIDEQSLNRWIRIELKRFGANIMNGNEKTIRVDNGKALLPEHFWQLTLAAKVELENICGEGDYEEFLQSSLFYKERREKDVIWDNQSDSFQFTNFKCVQENYYLKRAKVTANFKNPRYLKLTKGFNKEAVSPAYHKLSKANTHSQPWEINVVGDYINTNFAEGFIYIQFKGLEVDDQGEIMIPECNHNRISEYLYNYCRLRILKEIYVGGDDVNMVNQIQMYQQDTRDSFILAMTDAKAYGQQGWRNDVKKSRIKNMAPFENMLPNR